MRQMTALALLLFTSVAGFSQEIYYTGSGGGYGSGGDGGNSSGFSISDFFHDLMIRSESDRLAFELFNNPQFNVELAGQSGRRAGEDFANNASAAFDTIMVECARKPENCNARRIAIVSSVLKVARNFAGPIGEAIAVRRAESRVDSLYDRILRPSDTLFLKQPDPSQFIIRSLDDRPVTGRFLYH